MFSKDSTNKKKKIKKNFGYITSTDGNIILLKKSETKLLVVLLCQ